MTGNDNFENRLLSELRQVSSENPAPAARAEPVRTKRYGRFAAAGTGLAAVVAGIAIYTSTGDNTTSAYAVEKQDDGQVTVEIKSLRDADGLEQSLNAAGIPADVNYAPAPAPACTIDATKEGESGTTEAGESESNEADGPTPVAPTFDTSGQPPAGASVAAIPAEAVPAGAPSAAPVSGMATKGKDGTFTSTRADADGTTFTIAPGKIKPGEKVFITTSAPTTEPPKTGDIAAAVPASVAISIGDKPAPAPGC